MTTIPNLARTAGLGLLLALATAPAALANEPGRPSEGTEAATKEKNTAKASAATASPAAGPATAVEEQLRRQGAALERLEQLLLEQRAEIERLRSELDEVRAGAPAPRRAAGPEAAPTSAASVAARSEAVSPAPQAPVAGDETAKRVERLTKAFGDLKLTADVRFRYEGFWNQGLDAAAGAPARHRLRVRARAQIGSKIGDHFDWGVRLATGSFTDPVSTNATLTDYFERKPFAVDRAFLHFTTNTDPVNFDVYAGKFDFTWKRTSLTFDSDLQPEGLSERLRFKLGADSPLRGVTLVAWQLPIRERSVGADAYIYGGQVQTDWTWNDEWSSSLSGAFHDYEQANLIPPFTNVSPTVINAGLEYGTTNTVRINPFTNQPEFASKFRVVNVLADVTYRGLDKRFPVTLLVDYLHNTSAANNERDAGLATIQVGQRREEGDLYFEYAYWRAERDAYPSVFMESDVIPTNSENHWVQSSYMVRRNVEFALKYFWEQRLRTASPENRWLNRYQVDMIYSF